MSRLLQLVTFLAILICASSGIARSQASPDSDNDASSEKKPALSSEKSTHDSLWERFRQGFNLTNQAVDEARIKKEVVRLQSGLTSLENNLNRAKPYLHYIADQLEQADIPLDIAFLPLVESAFDPKARSNQGAVGIWQFIPTTARYYGLSINNHFDQRQDVIASTEAAISYLLDLNKTFDGDWLLSLAAYNTGPRNVSKAMVRAAQRGLKPTYWNLKLSKETTDYIPRLMAVTKVISNPEHYGAILPSINNRKQIETVTATKRISLLDAANLTAVTLSEISDLNPGLPNGMTPIYGPHRLVVPASIATLLDNKLEKMQHLLKVDRQTQLELVRRNISNPIAIDNNAQSDRLLDNTHYASSLSSTYKIHTVKEGDTLWSLSKRTGVRIATLRSWNNLTTDEPIRAGTHLKIAYISPNSTSSDGTTMNYQVAPADSLSSIATKFDMAISDLKRWNGSVLNENYIQVGQVLKIPKF